MKERPILFSGPMVRAILEGRKTMTRRVLKGVEGKDYAVMKYVSAQDANLVGYWPRVNGIPMPCPYGVQGDVLWVRETFRLPSNYDDATPEEIKAQVSRTEVRYLADGDIDLSGKNRPSIFMRRCWSRILLEVVSVRVERVQDITEDDAIFEGCIHDPNYGVHGKEARSEFIRLWELLNSKRGYGWIANPWVWVVEFKRAAAHTHNPAVLDRTAQGDKP